MLSCCILVTFRWEGLYCSCLTEMQCPLFRNSAHGPGCWFLSAWHKLQSSDQRSFSWVNASPRRPGGKSRVYSVECWMLWKGSCWATLEKVVLGIKQNRLNKPWQASQFACRFLAWLAALTSLSDGAEAEGCKLKRDLSPWLLLVVVFITAAETLTKTPLRNLYFYRCLKCSISFFFVFLIFFKKDFFSFYITIPVPNPFPTFLPTPSPSTP